MRPIRNALNTALQDDPWQQGMGQAFSSRFTIQVINTRDPTRASSRAMVMRKESKMPIIDADGASAGETLVFVYGTLKRGHRNHDWLMGASFRGDAVLPGAVLHDLGPFPMAISGDGQVIGEVYAVDEAGLARLDHLEGCPRLYERKEMGLADGRTAWVYLGRPHQVRNVPLMPDGLWRGRGLQHLSLQAMGLLGMGLLGIGLLPVGAAPAALALDSTDSCQAWRRSGGTQRILLGNRIGAAHYLTKQQKFQQSPPDAPAALYSPNDLRRVCGGR